MKFTAHVRAARFRAALLGGVALAAIPTAVQAQDRDELQEAQEVVDDDGDNIPIAEDSSTGNTIVVTATKREQTLQETPVAVSVTTAETIERAQIRDVTDLATVVPSLRVSQLQSAFATTYSIRGFGTDGNNIGLEPSVALFVDGVYRSRAISQLSDLPDIQRVEVLRGPQSTLFGKNASAGVISIVTKEPEFDFGGLVDVSYGNYDALVVKGYATGPITDSIAVSGAAGYNRRDGYLINAVDGNDINDRNRWFTRGQLLFDNGGAFRARIIGDYDEIDEKCCGVVNVLPSAATGAVLAVGGQVSDFRDNPDGDTVFTDVDPFSRIKNWGVSGQLEYSFGAVELTSITAYRDTELSANQDVDFTSARLATGANIGQADINTFTQELRLASDFDGPLNFLLGGYYFDEKVDTSDSIIFGQDFRPYANILLQAASGGAFTVPSLEGLFSQLTGQNFTGQFFAAGQGFLNNISQDNEAYSFFGNVDFEITPELVLTLGANYTKDKKSIVTNSQSTDVFSNLNLTAIRNTATQVGIAQTIGGILGVPGGFASAAQIQGFAAAQPGAFQQISAGAAAATAPLLGLTSLQFLPPLQNCPNAVEDCATNDDDWSYTARLAYEITPTLNVYASYATGYKAPSFNLSRDSRPLPGDFAALVSQGLAVPNLRPGTRFAEAEESTVYEVGIKGNWEYASANLTLFQQSIDDFQANTFTGTGFILSNAGERKTYGVEFDGLVRPTPELTFNLAMTYLDSTYESFVNSPIGDLSGEEVAGIPELSAVIGAQYDREVNSAGDRIILRGDFSYQSPVQVVAGLVAFIDTNPVTGARDFTRARSVVRPYRREVNDLNASFTYAFDMGLELSVWGRNLLDDRDITTVFDSVAQDESISGYPNQPRTYGVSARFRF
ncbi:TonB-dependent receptor [Qipengyuania sp. MTN3-11]|uniref:TonB-dependent receptor n=1 Tax=Qipengyuania sp. MTN3-11 TaxID=3056557 RepID=UPI0036F24673